MPGHCPSAVGLSMRAVDEVLLPVDVIEVSPGEVQIRATVGGRMRGVRPGQPGHGSEEAAKEARRRGEKRTTATSGNLSRNVRWNFARNANNEQSTISNDISYTERTACASTDKN